MWKNFAEQKWVYVVISVLLATTFWFYVRRVEDPELTKEIRNVPVTLSGLNVLENQGLTISKVSEMYVDITIRANISTLNQLNSGNVSASVDVSKCSMPKEYELAYTITLPTNASDAVVVNKTPDTLSATVERLYTEVFDIEFSLRGSIAEGYQAGKHTVSPTSVIVSGAEDQIEQIGHVVAVLEKEELSERFSGELPLVLEDAAGNALTNLEVKLSASSAFVTLPVVVVKEIPLTVNIISGGGAVEANVANLKIQPETITVAGSEEDIASVKEISIGSIDLSKVIGTNTFNFPINLDSRLENVSGITEASVTLTVDGLATRAIDVTNIEIINAPSGYDVVAETQMRTVVLRGEATALKDVDSSQLRIVADLTGVSVVGSISVPVKVYLDATDEVGVFGEYAIVVNINK